MTNRTSFTSFSALAETSKRNSQNLQLNILQSTMSIDDVRELLNYMENEEVLMKYNLPSTPRKDGYYHVYANDPSRSTGRRQLKAKTLNGLIVKILAFEHGEYGSVPKTFKEVFQIIQTQELEGIKNKARKDAVTSTVARHYGTYRRFFEGTAFENMKIGDINKYHIENLLLKNLSRYDLKKSAYKAMWQLVDSTFKFAFQAEWIRENPCLKVPYNSTRFTNKLVESESIENRLYSSAEMDALYHEAEKNHERFPNHMNAYAMQFQMLTGTRRGEICPLKWTDIEVDEDGITNITIRRELVKVAKSPQNPHEYQDIVEHTKTHKNRKIPVWDELAEFLTVLREVDDKYYPGSEYLFPAVKSMFGCIGIYTVYTYFCDCCDKLDIRRQKETIRGPHAWRRNFAKRIKDTNMASKILGNDPRVLENNYWDGLDMQAALTKLNAAPLNKVFKKSS